MKIYDKILIMKKINIKIRELILSEKKKPSGCETFIYEPSNIEEDPLGELYVIGWVKNKKREMEFLPNLIASIAKREFYSFSEKDPDLSFENCLKKVNATLLEMSQENKNLRRHVSFCIINTSSDKLRFSQMGEHFIYLLRSNSLIDIGKTKDNSNVFSAVISGDIKEEDKFIFATSKIRDLFSKKSITKLLSYDVDKQAEIIHHIYDEASSEMTMPSQAVLVFEAEDPKEIKTIKNVFGKSKKIETKNTKLKYLEDEEGRKSKIKELKKSLIKTAKKKKWFIFSLILLIILIISASLYVKMTTAKDLVKNVKIEITKAEEAARDDKNTAINSLKGLEDTVKSIGTYPFYADESEELSKIIEKKINEINGVFNTTEIERFGKISGKAFGFTPRFLFENNGDIYVFSDSVNVFYKIKSGEISGSFSFLDENDFETNRAFDDGNGFIFINYTNGEVYSFDPETDTIRSVEDEKSIQQLLRLKPSNYNKEYDGVQYTLDKNQIIKNEEPKKYFNFLNLIRINDFLVSDDRESIYLLSEREVFKTPNR